MKSLPNDLLVLIQDIKSLIKKARYNAVSAVNTEMLRAYYEIGKRIVEEEQGGSERAGYGEKLINSISAELIKEFGRGFSSTSLKNMRIFYLTYRDRIGQSVTDEFSWKLSWTHYCELIKIDDESKRSYFKNYADKENMKKLPSDLGYIAAFWTVTLLCIHLCKTMGTKISSSTMRRCLHTLRYAFNRPRIAPNPNDPEAGVKVHHIAQTMINAPKNVVFLCEDESTFRLLPAIRSMWMKVVPSGWNKCFRIFGALNIRTGEWHYSIFDKACSSQFKKSNAHKALYYIKYSVV